MCVFVCKMRVLLCIQCCETESQCELSLAITASWFMPGPAHCCHTQHGQITAHFLTIWGQALLFHLYLHKIRCVLWSSFSIIANHTDSKPYSVNHWIFKDQYHIKKCSQQLQNIILLLMLYNKYIIYHIIKNNQHNHVILIKVHSVHTHFCWQKDFLLVTDVNIVHQSCPCHGPYYWHAFSFCKCSQSINQTCQSHSNKYNIYMHREQ